MMGLLVAGFVLTQQVCDYQCELINAEITEERDADANEQEEPVVLQAQAIQMLPAVSIEIEPFEAFFIRKLFVDSEEPLSFIAEVSLDDTHFFKTLFRQIQSPNAP